MVEPFVFNDFETDEEQGRIPVEDEFTSDFSEYSDSIHCEEEEIRSEPEGVDVEQQTRVMFEQAYQQGEKAGFEMGMKKVDALVARLNAYMEELIQFKEELVKRSEGLTIELALQFSESIVLKSCEDNREIVADMVRKALEMYEAQDEIVVRVRRDDMKYFRNFEGFNNIRVTPDDSLREPGFVIETNFGDLDGKISTQIEELRKYFEHGQLY